MQKSIVYATNHNITNNITTNNITNNNTINNNNNTFIINNYGSERLDYLSDEDMYTILTNSNNIPLYIEKKHFNKEFPEIIIFSMMINLNDVKLKKIIHGEIWICLWRVLN